MLLPPWAATVGCVGWKYFAVCEHLGGVQAIDLPAYLVDTLRELAGCENMTNTTAILMHPDTGLRTFCSPAEIAYFEYTNIPALVPPFFLKPNTVLALER